MADLTLERIEKIRVDIEQNASDESYWDAREELLDAAERGLTGGWVRNGPDVEKPKCKALLFTQGKYWGEYLIAAWGEKKSLWFDTASDDYWRDEEVSHFMAIKEPTP